MWHFVFVILFLLAPCLAFAAAETPVIALSVENDMFADEDNNYTSGVRLGWAGVEAFAPEFLSTAANRIGLLEGASEKRWAFEVGQNMYSPTSLTDNPPKADDRPYAGWLYAGLAASGREGAARDTFSLTFGLVGPFSLANESQDIIHVLGGGIRPRGWGSQLKTEPGLILGFERRWPSLFKTGTSGLEVDASPALSANLGNIHTHAGANMLLRLGQNLDLDEGPALVRPSMLGNDTFKSTNDWGWYLFAGSGGRAVARDIFLDGNTWQNSAFVEKKNLVAEFQAGFAVIVEDVRLAYTHVFRSREFEGQDAPDSYGAFTLSWRY